MSSEPPEAPSLWIIAGANGSGKSSAYNKVTIEAPQGSIWIINPDELSKRIADQEAMPLTPDANLQAVTRIEEWLYASVRAHQTVGVETVLSTGKYRKLVDCAHDHGFKVRLIYVVLQNADLNVERVKIRVQKGGHDVPEASIRDRRTRSLKQLVWFFEHADSVDIFDNSGAEPTRIVQRRDDAVTIYGQLAAELLEALDEAMPGLKDALKSEE